MHLYCQRRGMLRDSFTYDLHWIIYQRSFDPIVTKNTILNKFSNINNIFHNSVSLISSLQDFSEIHYITGILETTHNAVWYMPFSTPTLLDRPLLSCGKLTDHTLAIIAASVSDDVHNYFYFPSPISFQICSCPEICNVCNVFNCQLL